MNRSADWLHQAQADLELAGVSAAAGHHEWAYYGRLQSEDALRHARSIVDAIAAALA
jgi:HEPN domain-containing protein